MTPLRDRVLAALSREGKPVSVRELIRRLDLGKPSRSELTDLLRRLIADGEVVNIRGGRVGLPSRMNLVVGRLTCNPAGYGFVIPEAAKGRGEDVYVSAVNMKEALHGDRVVARIERRTPKGPEGRIIRVLERGLQRIVGRYADDGRFGGHVVPFDKRVLHELFIPPGDNEGARPGEMVSAEITRPPTATRNPSGRVLQVLGRLEDPGVDLKVVMAKYELPDAFPAEVEEEAVSVASEPGEAEIRGRTDFRSWTTVTIDPETARDHDDAVAIERAPNGHWRLAVHIADVSDGARPGEMVSAEITRPPTATRNPSGRVLQVLGRLEDPGVDLKVVMAKYELPDAFPAEVEEEAVSVASEPGEAEIRGRTDFRSWTTVTIDPETARDHDDAVAIERAPNGHWRLAVHIADVSDYVRPGTALDQEAYLRGTSVYFPDRVVPMLPHALSSNVCSLLEGKDRLTQSAVLELDAKGHVRKAEFHDGVIRSAARLTYQQVQAIVDGDADERRRHAPLVGMLQDMDALAKLMRKRRYERGSLDFDLPEPKLVLGASGQMTGIVATERLDSMRLVEEFMLAANEAVAAKLSKAGMPALFRIHEQPDPERVEEFAELVASFGYRVPANLEAIRPQDFQLVLRQIEGKPEEKLVSYLLLRTMKLARYHEENLGHFGLATEMYAHFTSPIRRYPDLVVHRALRTLRQGQAEGRLQLPADLSEMGRHLSEMERRATEAERELVEWKKVRFMTDKLGEVYQGYVTGVQAFGLFVELEEIYVQGLVHVSSMTDDYYRFDERAHALKGENRRQAYRLGDKVEVQVVRVDLERRTIDFALVDVLRRSAAGARKGRPARSPAPRRGGRVSGRTGRRR
ncbi:MAG: ribonuclease R [Acidobacteria bacterium]|nr:MAG: ribonuclease R [Acidobacteriota bacterium]